ncbi:MAG: VanW family protein, partial [Nocardioides sp.]
ADGKLPKGTSVAGIDIGGQTRSEAEATLRAELTGRSRVPINLTVDGAPQSIAPETAGLGLDITGSVAQARPISGWSPSELWRFWAGGEDLDAALKVDDEQFTGTLDTLAAGVAQPARDGEIRFRGKRIRVVKPQDGRALDVTAAAETLREAYLDEGAVAALETGPATPDIDEADVADALASFAKPAVSAPVTLSFSGQRVTLAPDAFGSALEMVPEAGALVPRVKSKVLTSLLEGKVDNEDAPVDATVRIVDGRPQVIKAQPGVGYAQPTIDEALIKAASGADGSREASVKAGKAKASFTTKDARALKIRRKVSTFTTYYPYAEYRNINIPRAAELVNGTVLKPGETFSLNETVGERTTANGFTTGFIIRNGLFAEDLGGGVSQMATTTYNAAYFAGLEDVEHWPHSFFIDRYPPGREATVAWGSKDLRFKNDTPYGVLIQASVARATPSSSGVVTVSIWSTKLWDVATSASGRYNLTQPKEQTIIDRDGTCVPNVGYGGFDIDVTRYWRKPGTSEVVKQETDHTTYIPADTVICKQPDAPAP